MFFIPALEASTKRLMIRYHRLSDSSTGVTQSPEVYCNMSLWLHVPGRILIAFLTELWLYGFWVSPGVVCRIVENFGMEFCNVPLC